MISARNILILVIIMIIFFVIIISYCCSYPFILKKNWTASFASPNTQQIRKKNWQSSEVLEGSLQLFQAPGDRTNDPPWHSLKLTILCLEKCWKTKGEDSASGTLGQQKGISGAFAVSLLESTKAVTPKT